MVYFLSKRRVGPIKENFAITSGFYQPTETQNGETLYMYYAWQPNILTSTSANSADIFSITGGDEIFNASIQAIVDKGARKATPEELSYYLRNGGYKWDTDTIFTTIYAEFAYKPTLVVSKTDPATEWIPDLINFTGNIAPGIYGLTVIEYSICEYSVQGGTVIDSQDPNKNRWTRYIFRFSKDKTGDKSKCIPMTVTKAELDSSINNCRTLISTLAFNKGSDIKLTYADASGINYKLVNTTTRADIPQTDSSSIITSCAKVMIPDASGVIIQRVITDDYKTSCKTALNILYKSGIKYGNFNQITDCKLLQNTDYTPGQGDPPKSFVTPTVALLNITKKDLTQDGIHFEFQKAVNTYSIGQLDGFWYVFEVKSATQTAPIATFRFYVTTDTTTKIYDPFPLTIDINETAKTITFGTKTRRNNNTINAIAQVNPDTFTKPLPENFRLYNNDELTFNIKTYPNRSALDVSATNVSYTDINTNANENLYIIYSTTANNTTPFTRPSTSMLISYSTTKPNIVQATFSYGSGIALQSRSVPGGNYQLAITGGATLTQALTASSQFNRIEIDISGGFLQLYNGSATVGDKLITPIRAGLSAPFTFTLALKDPTGANTYYTANYSLFPRTYQPAAEAAKTEKEVALFILDNPVTVNVAKQYCTEMNGTIATIQELQAELNAGANWLVPGWVNIGNDARDEPVYQTAYPVLNDNDTVHRNIDIERDNGFIYIDAPTRNGQQLVSNILCFRKKEGSPSNVTVGSPQITLNQQYFNAVDGIWKRGDTPKPKELFLVTQICTNSTSSSNNTNSLSTCKTHVDLAKSLGVEKAYKEDHLDTAQKAETYKPDIPIPGHIADSETSYMILNESVQADGKVGVVESTQPNANYYMFGIKSTAKAKLAADSILSKTVTILPYNARLNIDSITDTPNYRTYVYSTEQVKSAINRTTDLVKKAALMADDVQASTNGFFRNIDKNDKDPYIGCDVSGLACMQLNGTDKHKVAPAKLVSRSNKYKNIDTGTFRNPTDLSGAVALVLQCQKLKGAALAYDGQYPGCTGPCCIAEDPTTTLDGSMFDGACEQNPATQEGAEQCDETDQLAPQEQQFQPFRLTRVHQRQTPTAARCTKPRIVAGFSDYNAQTAREIQYMHKQAHLQGRMGLF